MSSTGTSIPNLVSVRQQERAESLLATAYRSGITDPKELANFMGQTQHESQHFTRLEENLNYHGPVLWNTFKGDGRTPPRNGLTENEANELGSISDPTQKRQAIAEKIYGGAWGEKNLGNTEPHDGYTYRGRGYIQLTGRGNYERHSNLTGLDLIKHPELASNSGIAEKLAVSYWTDNIRTERGASTDIKIAGSIINTGRPDRNPKGLADRQANAAAWEVAIGKEGYLEEVLKRHPAQATETTPSEKRVEAQEQQPLPLKLDTRLSPESQRLIRDSEQLVRQIAERHHLPWNPGMDNTVYALAQQAREQGLTGITHMKVIDGQIRFAQFDGGVLRHGELGARAAANTDAQQSVAQMAQADQQPAQREPSNPATDARAMEAPALAL